MKNKPAYAIDSVDHALHLVQLLQHEGPLRVTDAAERLDVSRSTAHRLLAMLVEVSTFRAAGEYLRAELGRGSVFFPRDVGLEEPYLSLAPDPLEKITLEALGVAAAAALAPRPELEFDVSHVAPLRESVKDALVEVAGRLRGERVLSFRELCGPGRNRIEVVVRFLALLELYKAGAIDLYQGERFADIRASWADEVDLEEVLTDVDEYSLPGGER